MSTTVDAPPTPGWPAVPTSAWALAWSFVAGQVIALAERGPQDDSAWPLSILAGVVVVTFVSHGVMRARWVRFWLVVLLLVASAVAALFDLVNDGWTAAGAALLGLSLLQLLLLDRFSRTEWFSWHAARRPDPPPLTSILLVAALVGVLGGVLGASPDGIGAHLDL
ncbi:hypothetical protein L2K70_19765 [Nocardioides KLBMP 9356]|uniref:Uncharacterized protein n=1 Tax=Nocardioides potassii TaxID=2911371 RepID=A0ABS9HFG2_9ACTN|nr:hypothetical protein [Nocardioides potassii]MCF6379856.1 hypothetical protein [Nocardioides potassii]